MSNLLKMAKIQSILSLHAQGWPARRIARELGVDRETVRKYVLRQSCEAKPANLPTGSDESKPADLPPPPGIASKPAGNLPTGSARPETSADQPTGCRRGPPNLAEPYRETILAGVAAGLSAKRIHQDLVAREATVGYDSVRRFIRRLGASPTPPFRRMECAAGEEAQVDFGTGAPLVGADGKRRKTHVFRIVLSHSRKGYSEATLTQTTEDFLRALENAFRHFGGVPKTLVIDNLKAAVTHPDWFDPELTPKVQSFARHYGTVVLPTKPYTPRHCHSAG